MGRIYAMHVMRPDMKTNENVEGKKYTAVWTQKHILMQ